MVMQTIAAQEIKRQGIKAVDDLVSRGAVQIIARNKPAYVVMDMDHYQELMEGYNEAYVARVLAAEAAIARGEGHRYATVVEHMAAILAAPDGE